MNENIMENENVEVAEELISPNYNGLKALGIGAVVAGLAFGGYKLIKKLKSNKNDGLLVNPKPKTESEECSEDDYESVED